MATRLAADPGMGTGGPYWAPIGGPDCTPFDSLLAQNTIGTLPPSLPVFIAQGDNDQTVRPQVTRDYAARLCAAHSRVTYMDMPGVGHGTAAMKSTLTAISWIADRFAGVPPPDSCPVT